MVLNPAETKSTWWLDDSQSWVQYLAGFMLKKNGPIPRHVAFVMDGNRRFARLNKMDSVIHGHERGFEQLARILSWCHDMKIFEITVYAFSIENFKRSEEEVNGLMKLAEEKFRRLLQEEDKLKEKQIAFRFWGALELLNPTLGALIADIELKTKHYTKGVINICMPYTSRDSMARAGDIIRTAVMEKILLSEVGQAHLEAAMDSRRTCKLDLVIRTSGEMRMSDFLLAEAQFTHIQFTNVLWPDYSFHHFFWNIFQYQSYVKKISDLPKPGNPGILSDALVEFIEQQHLNRLDTLKRRVPQLKFNTNQAN